MSRYRILEGQLYFDRKRYIKGDIIDVKPGVAKAFGLSRLEVIDEPVIEKKMKKEPEKEQTKEPEEKKEFELITQPERKSIKKKIRKKKRDK